jgi:hypothetical protein
MVDIKNVLKITASLENKQLIWKPEQIIDRLISEFLKQINIAQKDRKSI